MMGDVFPEDSPPPDDVTFALCPPGSDGSSALSLATPLGPLPPLPLPHPRPTFLGPARGGGGAAPGGRGLDPRGAPGAGSRGAVAAPPPGAGGGRGRNSGGGRGFFWDPPPPLHPAGLGGGAALGAPPGPPALGFGEGSPGRPSPPGSGSALLGCGPGRPPREAEAVGANSGGALGNGGARPRQHPQGAPAAADVAVPRPGPGPARTLGRAQTSPGRTPAPGGGALTTPLSRQTTPTSIKPRPFLIKPRPRRVNQDYFSLSHAHFI